MNYINKINEKSGLDSLLRRKTK